MTAKKRGPKPTGNALTATQRKQKQRAKQSCLIKAAKDAEFKPHSILISKRQLLSIAKFEHLRTHGQVQLDQNRINEIVFYALKRHLNSLEELYRNEGHDKIIIDTCAYSDDGSNDLNALMHIQIEATKLFEEWEKQQ